MGKVVVFGTFDGLHPGHINFFEQAKKLGDYLVVVVGRDVTVNEVKGRFPKRSELLRLKAVKQCQLVNEAMLGNIGNPYEIIKKIKPDIIALGYDQNSFTKNLPDYKKKENLKIEIMRLMPHKPETYKSSLLEILEIIKNPAG
ncbi:MAG: adenylyltransferase/cytidyltransferase family protein [Minisyncoccales bacterium]